MNIKRYLAISGAKIGDHIGTHGKDITQADYERLWQESLEDFFATEPLSHDARRSFQELDLEARKLYFVQSIFSLERFVALASKTFQTHQH